MIWNALKFDTPVDYSLLHHFSWYCSARNLSIEADNGSDHRAGTIDLQADKNTRKSGFACIALISAPLGERFFTGKKMKNLVRGSRNTYYRVCLTQAEDCLD